MPPFSRCAARSLSWEVPPSPPAESVIRQKAENRTHPLSSYSSLCSAQHRNRECLGASGFGAGGGSHECPAAGAEPSFGSIQQLLMVTDPTGSAFQGNKTLAAQLFGVFGAQSETAPGSSSASLQGAVMHPATAPQ